MAAHAVMPAARPLGGCGILSWFVPPGLAGEVAREAAALERWISWSIAERPDPDQRQLPLGTLALQLAGTRRGHANLGDDGSSAWLFPGGRPGQPISAFQLTERLRQIGIRCGQARSAALFQLATELPAAVLARMLGIHIAVAVAWQRACSGDWASYAAEVARRPGQRTPEQT